MSDIAVIWSLWACVPDLFMQCLRVGADTLGGDQDFYSPDQFVDGRKFLGVINVALYQDWRVYIKKAIVPACTANLVRDGQAQLPRRRNAARQPFGNRSILDGMKSWNGKVPKAERIRAAFIATLQVQNKTSRMWHCTVPSYTGTNLG
jgi:hypothetical protein